MKRKNKKATKGREERGREEARGGEKRERRRKRCESMCQNVGMIGNVAHGKSTLTKALSG